MRNYFSGFLAVLFLLTAGCTVEEDDKKKSSASNDLALGASANDFLSDEVYTSLKIEIVYVTDHAPSEASLTVLKSFLQKYTHKPDGISFIKRAIPAPGMGTYSLSELKEVEKQNRSIFTSGTSLGTYIFFADEKSEASTSTKLVLGKAYKNTSMVIFDKEVEQLASASSSMSKTDVEHTTLRHEFGHLFGLVNNGSPAQSQHEDSNPDYKAHCNVEGCLMAATLEFGGAIDLIDGNETLDFDEKCQLDLKANGGK